MEEAVDLTSRRPLRLFHTTLGQRFIVDGDVVYGDLDGDGRIASRDRYTGPYETALVAAARHFNDYFDVPYPGAKGPDAAVVSGGVLNRREYAALRGAGGVPARRPDLLGHLDFFDRHDRDGLISISENYRGWRDLGYGVIKSLTLALGSAVVFGRPSSGFAIDVERIAERRPTGATGVYGPDGNVDPARLAEFVSVFDSGAVNGTLTHDQLKAALADRARLGAIPKRQFGSFLLLTERINGAPIVTKEQFVGLFDNSLLWMVASMPDRSGIRRL